MFWIDDEPHVRFFKSGRMHWKEEPQIIEIDLDVLVESKVELAALTANKGPTFSL
jgi:hypothetical protein